MLPSTTDDTLFNNFSPGDLYRYRRTSKGCREAVDSYIRRHFRLHDLLRWYFDTEEQIIRFRHLQSLTGMFISGSVALQFLDRTEYHDSDLDLYVEHRFRWLIASWLVKEVGYTYKPSSSVFPLVHQFQTLDETLEWLTDLPRPLGGTFYTTTPKGYSGAEMILNFEKPGSPPRKIQLITKQHSMLQMVLNFHSTCVMNVITHDKAYSIFPRATFDERRSLLQLPMKQSRQQVAIEKYSARGFSVISNITREEFSDPTSSFISGNRHLGDDKCWTLPILPKLDLPESTIETNSWALFYDANLHPNMVATVFVSEALRYGYLLVDESLRKYVADEASEALGEIFVTLQTEEERHHGLDYIFADMILDRRTGTKYTNIKSNVPKNGAEWSWGSYI